MSKRGENIYKRKDGRYEGRYATKNSIDGKTSYCSVYAHSYAEVKRKLESAKYEERALSKESNINLSEWLKSWIENNIGIKETTRSVYRSYINNQIIPIIGDIPLKNINKSVIQEFVSSLGTAPSTTKSIFTVLKAALSSAEENGYINNVWANIKLRKADKKEIRILSLYEQNTLEKALNNENDIGITMSLYMGLRIGEICALRWKDIDFEKAMLHISGTQTRTNIGICVSSPKSKSSVRYIPIPEFLMKELKNRPHNGEYIISNNGTPIDVRTYRRRFKKILSDVGLPDIKFHALRHTFATRALEAGMDYKTLSEILGHSTVAITLDIYVHSSDEYKRRQLNKLCEFNKPS